MLTSRFNWIGTPKYDEDGFPRSNKCPIFQSDPNPRRGWANSNSFAPPSSWSHSSPAKGDGLRLAADGSGMYKGGQFKFTFNINPNYPHEPPKVLCTQKVFSPSFTPLPTVADWKIYHPNLDLQGNICLWVVFVISQSRGYWRCRNILREDWKPVCRLSHSPGVKWVCEIEKLMNRCWIWAEWWLDFSSCSSNRMSLFNPLPSILSPAST